MRTSIACVLTFLCVTGCQTAQRAPTLAADQAMSMAVQIVDGSGNGYLKTV